MADSEPPEIKIYQAAPPEHRRIVAINRDQKVSRPNLIPDDIMRNEFLNTLIDSSLPKNYNFEIHKSIWKIKQTESKRVLLQLPEGLMRFGTVLVDIITGYFKEVDRTDIEVIIMGDLTYGACCIDDYLASSMGCDLVIHYAHSCLVPINKLNKDVKYLYVFLDIKFDLGHVTNCVKHNFNPKEHTIALASTIQFVSAVHELAKVLRQSGYHIALPQSRPLSSGEVLGCTAPKLDSKVNTIIFICDGRFHLEALMIANPNIKAYRYDPYSRKLSLEIYEFAEMYTQRMAAINSAVGSLRSGGNFGFVLGTLGRQGSEKVYDRLIERLVKHTDCEFLKILMPEVLPNHLNGFPDVDVWVQVACPRLSIDWGSFYDKPLLNPYEFIQSIKIFLNLEKSTGDIDIKNYPMDFYAKNSCCDHTPNHTCQENQNCECERLNNVVKK